ncbi:homeobox protein NANOG-like [Antechinus flavipes]|uniref:homeobox protein NANOG-like n=1 Tax=Antechinus flavipes TaxID=38775 RepID=UPI002236B53D|nr:homeobox protein NANOG-like [Antechinus flavipes]
MEGGCLARETGRRRSGKGRFKVGPGPNPGGEGTEAEWSQSVPEAGPRSREPSSARLAGGRGASLWGDCCAPELAPKEQKSGCLPSLSGVWRPVPLPLPSPKSLVARAPASLPGKWDADRAPRLSLLSPPAFAPAPQPLNALVQDPPGSLSGPTVQENKVDQSKGKKQKTRTTFTQEQLNLLRNDFAVSRYITPQRGRQLAQLLGLSYKQVKTWFQNQRLKAKRPQMVPASSLHDPRLPQLGPAVGPQGFNLPSSFPMDPVNNHPRNYSGWSDQTPEGWLPNYGEAASPYLDGLPTPLHYPPAAPMGHGGWSCPVGPQTSAGACGPLGVQRQLAPLPSASEAGSAYRPAPGGGGVPLEPSYPMGGPVLSTP